jgi:hypothetical protein
MELLFKKALIAAVFAVSSFLFVNPKPVEIPVGDEMFKSLPKPSMTFLYRMVGLLFMVIIMMMILKNQI